MFDRIHPWSHLVLAFCLVGALWLLAQSHHFNSFFSVWYYKMWQTLLVHFLNQTCSQSFPPSYIWRPHHFLKGCSLTLKQHFQVIQLVVCCNTQYNMCSNLKLNSELRVCYLSFSIIILISLFSFLNLTQRKTKDERHKR